MTASSSSSSSTTTEKYYISVTGLRLKSLWVYPQFLKYAIPSTKQARSAPGNVETRTTMRHGIQHTLTVWQDRPSMIRYMRSGAHAQAMKVADQLSAPNGTRVYGYESDTIPTWDEALELWQEHGTRHGKIVKEAMEYPIQQRHSTTARTTAVVIAVGVIASVLAILAIMVFGGDAVVDGTIASHVGQRIAA